MFEHALITPAVLSKLWFSLWESVITVILSLLIGGGLAFLGYTWKTKRSAIFDLSMVLPIFLPGVIVATGFISVWGNSGYVNSLLATVNLPHIKFLYSPYAIIAGHLFYNIPLAYIAVRIRLTAMHGFLEEAARVLGASGWQTFRDVTWTRIKSTVIGTGIIIFLYSFMSFNIPLILGGVRYQTLEVYIYTLVTQQLNFDYALQLALFQFAALSLIIVLHIRHLTDFSEKKSQARLDADYQKSKLVWIIRTVLMFFVLLPSVGVIVNSMDVRVRGGQILSLGNYVRLGTLPYWQAFIRSLLLGSASTVTSLVLSLTILFHRSSGLGKWLVFLLGMSPVTLGLVFLLLFGKSLALTVVTYTILFLPLNFYILSSLWNARPVSFLETLRLLGASRMQSLIASTRYLLPAIGKGAALSLALAMGDVAVSSLLTPFGEHTAMSLSYSLLGSYGFRIAAAGMSVVLISIVMIISSIHFTIRHYDPRRS